MDVAAVHEVVAVVRDAGVLKHEAADNHHKALDEQRRLKGMPHPAEMDVGNKVRVRVRSCLRAGTARGMGKLERVRRHWVEKEG